MTSLRRPAAVAALTLALVGCGDPADLAREVVEARGECDQDSLKASSEACVQMFERYGEMATEMVHTYIGGMKAMDAALDRLPAANFDTSGLGHAISPAADGATDGDLDSGLPPRAGRGVGFPPGAVGAADAYPEEWSEPAWASPGPTPPPQRGVLRPPEERLRRPWLEPREDEPEEYDGLLPDEPGPDFREFPEYEDEPPSPAPRRRPAPGGW